VKLTQKLILFAIEGLDWRGHVELPAFDMQWLAAQLYVRLVPKEAEVCDVCNKAAPFVLETALGNICADCVEDMNDNVDQIREVMGNTEEGRSNGGSEAAPKPQPVGFLGRLK
jgi:hypothetical protein